MSGYRAKTREAKIGRQLKVDLIPRSLSGASSAEIDVTMNVGETAEPTVYSAGQSQTSNDNLSRVATHSTTSKVRVDSLKLFEISAFSAKLQRSRSRFPIVPPFVELPYIGTIVGIPLPSAKEYHTSVAILSAVVVPTAADLAYGLRFVGDDLADWDQSSCRSNDLPICVVRKAVALSDLNHQPIRNFHKAMVNCLATEMRTWNPTRLPIPDDPTDACMKLSFSDVLRDPR